MCTHQGVCHIFMRNNTRAFFLCNSFSSSSSNTFFQHESYRLFESFHLRFFEFLPLPSLPPLFLLLPPPLFALASVRFAAVLWVAAARPAAITALMIMMPVFLPSASRVVSAFKRTGWRRGCWLSLWGGGPCGGPRSPPSRKRGALGGLSILSC